VNEEEGHMEIACITDEIDRDPRVALEIGIRSALRCFEIRSAYGERFPRFTAETMDFLVKMKDEHDLQYTAVSPGIFKKADDGNHEALFAKARTLGAKRMIVFAAQTDVGYEEAIHSMRSLASEAAAGGFELLLENAAGTLCRSAGEVSSFIADVGVTNLKANWDPANAVTAGFADTREEYLKVAPHIGAVHVKDLVSTDDGSRPYVPVGAGEIDYPRLIRDLREVGYSGYLTIETHCHPELGPFEESLAYLREILG